MRESVQVFTLENVIRPGLRLYKQVFRTSLSNPNQQSVALSKDSFNKLLVDYSERHLSHVPGAIELAEQGNMQPAMNAYLHEVRRPMYNFLFGNLSETMLLQVQKLKCDVEELMLKSKQQLQAQELNLALVALVPAVLFAGALLVGISRATQAWRQRGTELVVTPEQTVRFLLGSVYDTLILIQENSSRPSTSQQATFKRLQRMGELVFHLYEVKALIDKGVLNVPPKVSEKFAEDVSMLESFDVSVEFKVKHLHKMWSCYPFFMPLPDTG